MTTKTLKSAGLPATNLRLPVGPPVMNKPPPRHRLRLGQRFVVLTLSLGMLAGILMTAGSASAAGSWGNFPLTGPNATSGDITSVSRAPNTMETWWIANNGSVQGAYYCDGQEPPWGYYQLAPPGSAMVGGAIKAVSRAANTMEVFWEGPQASIEHASWYAGVGWTGLNGIPPLGPGAPPGSVENLTVRAVGDEPLAVVSRSADTIELWWVASDGSVQDANYTPRPTNGTTSSWPPPAAWAATTGPMSVERIATSRR